MSKNGGKKAGVGVGVGGTKFYQKSQPKLNNESTFALPKVAFPPHHTIPYHTMHTLTKANK